MSRQIILDTETTGLLAKDGHRLIEIGCIEMINRRFTGNHFHYYLNPQRLIDPGAFQVHGISNEFLQDKPLFSQIAEQFLAFIANSELIIHNASFDLGFLNAELERINKAHRPIETVNAIIDTLAYARQKHPGQSNSLDALCRRYHIDNTQRDLHGALLDAKLLAQVYLAMTGGQEQLFAVEDQQVLASQSVKGATEFAGTLPQRHALPILLPNAEELKSHQEFLNLFIKNSESLWGGS